jgi:CheY-like chemotaxis protein
MEPPTCAAVLLVEDEQQIRDSIAELLRTEGFQVYEAENAQQALAILTNMPRPAVVLADLTMDEMSGPAFGASLRGGDKFAALPIVLVSSDDASVPGGHRLAKNPIELNDLIQIVSHLCLRKT